jgi:urease accessory protein
MTIHGTRIAAALAACIALPTAALAHHPMGGMMPTTFMQGLLSGIGHPILGPDHLAFIVGIGLLAGIASFGPLLPALFVATMVAGLGLHVAGLNIPGVELLVAASVLLIGLAIWRQRTSAGTWLEGGAFALAGLFHGYAFAEAVIGAEPTPIAAYIAGLAATQLMIALGAYALGRGTLDGTARLSPVMVRACAAVIAAVGITFIATGSGIAG